MILRGKAGAALAALVIVAVAGCAGDGAKRGKVALGGGLLSGAVGTLVNERRGAGPAQDPGQLAAAALKSLPGPVMLAQIGPGAGYTVLGLYGENGDRRTYATPGEQAMVFRNGILVATRGYGNDLMSADPGAAGQLVRNRSAGSAERIWRYLDGNNVERPLRMNCAVQPGGTQAAQLGGRAVTVRQMNETCATGPLKIDNTYLVTDAGLILASRQWIGPGLGHVSLQVLRP